MGGDAKDLTGPDLATGIPKDELAEGKPLLGHAGGEAVVLVRAGDVVHAIGATCTHYGGPLAEGCVEGGTLRCPWHHARFDLATGEAVGAPALADAPCYELVQQGPLVQVRGRRAAVPKRRGRLSTTPSSVVLLGAGAAGAACAEMLRKEGYGGPITMLGDEEPGPVDRPNLSKDYLAGTAPEEWIPLGTAERYRQLEVELLPTSPATTIDPRKKTVTTRDGRTHAYGALLFAPGAEPSRAPLDAHHATIPVLTLRSLADARAIVTATRGARKVVIVGASFIGLEVAASLVTRGLEVHVVSPDTVPLARVLGEALGRHVTKLHEARGVHFHLGTTPAAVGDRVVQLANGQTLGADFVVAGVGVKPRVALAEAAGLNVDRGVVVDDQLRASTPDVWAAGDVARYPDPRLGEHVRVEHWVVAERQGQAAARSMLGTGRPFRDVPFFWSSHYATRIAYVGHAPSYDAVEVFGSIEREDAAVAFRRRGAVLAVATLNRDSASLAAEAAMERGDLAALDAILRA